MIRGACKCGQAWTIPTTGAGKAVQCPKCKSLFKVPSFVPASVPPAPGKHRGRVGRVAAAAVVLATLVGWGYWFLSPRPATLSTMFAAKAQGPAEPPGRAAILAYLNKFSGDPASVQVVEWGPTKAVAASWSGQPCNLGVEVTFRSKNAFGALVVGSWIFFLQGDRVVETISRAEEPYPYYVCDSILRKP